MEFATTNDQPTKILLAAAEGFQEQLKEIQQDGVAQTILDLVHPRTSQINSWLWA